MKNVVICFNSKVIVWDLTFLKQFFFITYLKDILSILLLLKKKIQFKSYALVHSYFKWFSSVANYIHANIALDLLLECCSTGIYVE